MEKNKALETTEVLLKTLNDIEELYESTKKNKNEYDFYRDIEPYVNDIQLKINQWENVIREELSKRNLRYFGEKQIEQIRQNVGDLAVQAFQHTTSYKRFKDHYQSTRFLLMSISKKLI